MNKYTRPPTKHLLNNMVSEGLRQIKFQHTKFLHDVIRSSMRNYKSKKGFLEDPESMKSLYLNLMLDLYETCKLL